MKTIEQLEAELASLTERIARLEACLVTSESSMPRHRSRWAPTETMLRIARMFHRRPATVWSAKELKAFSLLGAIDPGDLRLVEEYYGADIYCDEDYRRRDLQTFLNNFQSEVDRARRFLASRPTTQPQTTFTDQLDRPAKQADPALLRSPAITSRLNQYTQDEP